MPTFALPDQAFPVLLLAPFLVVLFLLWVALRPDARVRRARRVIDAHLDTLARRREQLVFLDDYGKPETADWEREVKRFHARVILPDARIADPAAYPATRAFAEIEARLARHVARQPPGDEVPTDPADYERFCARRLAAQGWQAKRTRGSGDQGADVIARKDGRTLVVQCKLYAKPVGNAAVQEVIAAAKYYRADVAAVVSNAGFTPSARRLAANAGVSLLHHDELDAAFP